MTTLEETRLLFRVAPWRAARSSLGMGSLFVLFGVVLAIDPDDFQLWDAWVIAGIVLWALLGAVGPRSGTYYTGVQKLAEERRPDAEAEVLARLRAPTGAAPAPARRVGLFVLLLLDMIFKPGA